MNVRRLTTSAVFLLLTLAIYPGGARSHQIVSEFPVSPSRPCFPQSVALSDFDADGLVDVARLDGSGLRRSIEILLSGTGRRSFLHFHTIRGNHGSLFAQDLDNDGATDLIWANPFQASDVVVWLGDGTGRFEQVDPAEYQSASGFGNAQVIEPDGSNQETAVDSDTTPPLDQTINQKRLDQHVIELPSHYPDRIATATRALGQPAGRDPPLHHS